MTQPRTGVLSPRIPNGDDDAPMRVKRIWDLPGQEYMFGAPEIPDEPIETDPDQGLLFRPKGDGDHDSKTHTGADWLRGRRENRHVWL